LPISKGFSTRRAREDSDPKHTHFLVSAAAPYT
jgi:hypothetical protein